MQSQQAHKAKPYTVSFFGQIALVLAVLMYLYATTFKPENINAFYTSLFILIIGVVLSFVMVGIKLIPFNFRSLSQDLVATIISFVSVLFVNRLVPVEIGVSPMGETAFGILSGVGEEWLFRQWLCAWIFKVTKSMLLALLISSFTWSVFHIARYGANLNLLWLVFLCGLPLGYVTLVCRSADGASFGHAAVNALARR